MAVRRLEGVDFNPSLAFKRGILPERTHSPIVTILHTTGAGPWSVWKAGKAASPFDRAVWLYTQAMKFSPHFVLCGETGRVVQVNPLDTVAWHVGGKDVGAYAKRGWWRGGCEWWVERFPKTLSPLHLCDGKLWKRGANYASYGIEISPPLAGPRAPITDAALASLAGLLASLSMPYTLTHSESHPRSRTRAGAPWDLGPEQWSPAVRERLGVV